MISINGPGVVGAESDKLLTLAVKAWFAKKKQSSKKLAQEIEKQQRKIETYL